MKQFAGAACALAAAAALGGCSYNEALGRNQLLLVDNNALAQASQQAWDETLRTNRVSQDARANARVRSVGQRLVQAAGLADRPWQYVVFENNTANAFVLPGGQIGVNTGLLAITENDDQLAAVIGHEIAHMTSQHAAERYSQTAATQAVLSGAGALLGGGGGSNVSKAIGSLGGVGAQVGVLLPFSRRHELEADRLGVDYMVRAGYRASEALKLWSNMAASRNGASTGGMLSTHPSDAERLAALQAHIRQMGYS